MRHVCPYMLKVLKPLLYNEITNINASTIITKANPTTGATEQVNITFTKAGDYDFKVVASNAAGAGKSTRKMLWIGRDVPAAPKNIVATYLGDNIDLEWEAPTAGLHAAYCDFTNMKY